jgi:hypothetical protein
MSRKRLTQHTEMDDSDRHFPAAVSPERWREAQQWELAFWNRKNLPSPFWKRLIRPLLVVLGLRAPFILNHQQLEPVLLSRFKPVLKRIVPSVELSEPEMHYGALVFAGRQLSADHL